MGQRARQVTIFCFAVGTITGCVSLFSDETAKDAKPALIEVARFPAYTEGPVIDRRGNVYVSHHPFVSRVTPQGEISVWADIGRPNGHAIKSDGTHLICDQNILLFNAAGELLETAATACGDHDIRKANDLVVADDGGFFFTDPGNAPEAYDKRIGRVCYIDADGESHLVAENLHFPNGLVLVDNEKTLLVSETMTNRVLSIDVSKKLKFGAPRPFAALPDIEPGQPAGPDGMAEDRAGNIYVAHYGMSAVQVFDRDGAFVRSITATANASNVVIAEAGGETLYITGGVEPGYPADGDGILQKVVLENR